MNDIAALGHDRKTRFRERFGHRKARQRIALACSLLAIVAAFWFFPAGGHLAVGVPVLILIGAYAFMFFNWRCPACYGHLGAMVDVHFCSICKFRID